MKQNFFLAKNIDVLGILTFYQSGKMVILCWVLNDGFIHYGLYTSISGLGGYPYIVAILALEDFSKRRLLKN